MRLRTFLGILLAFVVVLAVAYLSSLNLELLRQRFSLSEHRSLPVYGVFVVTFLIGFLPAVSVLLTQTLKQELAQRRQRKQHREDKSRQGSFRRAIDYRTDGQYGKAAAELEGCLSEKPEEFSSLLHYGEVLRRDGRIDEALEVHRRTSVLYPHSVAVLYQLIEDYEARGEKEVADQIRDRILRDFPGLGLAELRRRRDRALADREWRESAQLQERIDSLLAENGEATGRGRTDPLRLGLTYERAVVDFEADRHEEARRGLEKVLEAEPEFIPALLLRGEIELVENDAEAAVELWRRGFEITSNSIFLLRIEDHFIERQEPLEAIENLHRVIAATASDLVPRFFLGRLYYRLEMLDEALRVLAPLAKRVESSPTLYYLLARIHQRRGEMGQAVEAYQTCVQQAGLAAAQFPCRECGALYSEWIDRCDRCGSWNSIELRFDARFESSEEPTSDRLPRRAVYHREP